jgi:hypothetical protein
MSGREISANMRQAEARLQRQIKLTGLLRRLVDVDAHCSAPPGLVRFCHWCRRSPTEGHADDCAWKSTRDLFGLKT